MLDPISPIRPPIPPQPSTFPSSPPIQSISSIQSLKPPPNRIAQFFSAILNWLKWLFCCKKPTVPSPPSPVPPTAPSFSKRRYELTCNIFQTLGAGGPWHWYKHRTELVEWQKELESLAGDPFEFFYFLFHTEEMAQSTARFKVHASSSTATVVCALVGRQNPWEEFIAKQSNSLALRGSLDKIPHFCNLLKLNKENVTSLFINKQWRELILFIFESCSK